VLSLGLWLRELVLSLGLWWRQLVLSLGLWLRELVLSLGLRWLLPLPSLFWLSSSGARHRGPQRSAVSWPLARIGRTLQKPRRPNHWRRHLLRANDH
jgi:hypothetical protein